MRVIGSFLFIPSKIVVMFLLELLGLSISERASEKSKTLRIYTIARRSDETYNRALKIRFLQQTRL